MAQRVTFIYSQNTDDNPLFIFRFTKSVIILLSFGKKIPREALFIRLPGEIFLFPLNRRRRLAGYIVHDAVDVSDFVDDSA